MTRKHDEKQVDQSQVTWRLFSTSVNALIVAITAWIAAHMGTSNDTTGLQHSVERLTNTVEMLQGEVKATGNRMQMVETKIDSTIKRVDALQSAVDGVVRGMRL